MGSPATTDVAATIAARPRANPRRGLCCGRRSRHAPRLAQGHRSRLLGRPAQQDATGRERPRPGQSGAEAVGAPNIALPAQRDRDDQEPVCVDQAGLAERGEKPAPPPSPIGGPSLPSRFTADRVTLDHARVGTQRRPATREGRLGSSATPRHTHAHVRHGRVFQVGVSQYS